MTGEPYDPVTYFHWLHWRLRCLEAPPEVFERLFQDVAARAHDRFVRIRPYGRFGDRKIDGLFWSSGTAYQVYSPDQMREAETRRKIQEDLAGAVAHWGSELRHWTFVYNVRRGLPPDVVGCLKKQRRKYPDITIEPLSDDDLWKIAKTLPLQDRVEILGPPPGFEDLFRLGETLPQEIQERIRSGRFVVVQDILSPVNIHDAVGALGPAKPFGPPLFVRPPSVKESWKLAAQYQKALIDDALARSRERLPRFAVFSLSPIPLAIHLGFVLSDRVEVEPYHYHRDRRTWRWPKSQEYNELKFQIMGVPKSPTHKPIEAGIRVSVSADVHKAETAISTRKLPLDIELRVAEPDVTWLVSPGQVWDLGRAFRGVLADVRRLAPNCRRIHLFYAGPTGGAVVVGQAINPRMNPPVELYEYDRQRQPRYEHVLTLM